jgi:nucleolar protein 15
MAPGPSKVASTSRKTQKSKAPPKASSLPEKKVPLRDEGSSDENSDDDASVHLHGFSTDEDDSSDEDDWMGHDPSAIDTGKLPTVAKDDAVVKQRLEKAKRQPVSLSA